MPEIHRTAYESRIALAPAEQFDVQGQRVDAVTVPRSEDMSADVTLHGSREVAGYRVPADTAMHGLAAEHAARSAANPAAADAIRGEIDAGVRARHVTLPSEALSQAWPVAASAVEDQADGPVTGQRGIPRG